MRQCRFQSAEEISQEQALSYLREKIENENAGKRWLNEKTTEPDLTEVQQNALSRQRYLGETFEKLSLGKRKDYANHIRAAKREETQQARLEKIIPMIKSGIGLNDKYKTN